MLKLEVPPPTSAMVQRVRLDWPGEPDYELLSYRVAGDSPAAGRGFGRFAVPGTPCDWWRWSEMVGSTSAATASRAAIGRSSLSVFAAAADLSLLDPLFAAAPVVPSHLEAGRFFGELALNADAGMAEIAHLYGLSLIWPMRAGTLEDRLKRTFDQPVVGDRVRLGRVEFVVREMRGERIVRVGMKLKVAEGISKKGK